MEKWQTILILIVIAIGFSGLSFFGSQNNSGNNTEDIPPLFNPDQSQVTMIAKGVEIEIANLLPTIYVEAETEELDAQPIAEQLYKVEGVKIVNNPKLSLQYQNLLTFSATISFETDQTAEEILARINDLNSLPFVSKVRGQAFAVVNLPAQLELSLPNDENTTMLHKFEESMANAIIYSLDKKNGDTITADVAVVLAGEKALQIAVEEQVPVQEISEGEETELSSEDNTLPEEQTDESPESDEEASE